MKTVHSGLLIGLLSFAAVGCSGTQSVTTGISEVEGKVLSPQGSPIKGGTLVLRPLGGIRRPVSTEIEDDGTFSIDGSNGESVILPGDYEVYIVVGDNPQERKLLKQIPAKYRKLSDEDSDLLVSLDDSGKKLLVKLKRG